MQDEGDIQSTPFSRLTLELNELEAKIEKLENFFTTSKFGELHVDMQMLMTMQHHIMMTYRGLLIMRGDMMEKEFTK